MINKKGISLHPQSSNNDGAIALVSPVRFLVVPLSTNRILISFRNQDFLFSLNTQKAAITNA